MSVTLSTRRDDKSGDDNGSLRKLKDIYRIVVSSASDDQSTILNSNFAGIPQVGDSHPKDPLVTVKSRTVKSTDNRLHWIMTVSYDNSKGGLSDGGGDNDEAGTIINVQIGTWTESYTAQKDFDDKLYKDSANGKIKVELERQHTMITVTKNTFNPNLQISEMKGRVNAAPVNWLGFNFNNDQLLFSDYTANSLGNNNWQEVFSFKGRKVPDLISVTPDEELSKGWQLQILDAGFFEILEDGKRVPIYVQQPDGKKATRPVTQPWPLDGGGKAIPQDSIDDLRQFLDFRSVLSMPFNTFAFDFTPIFEPLPVAGAAGGGLF